MLRISLLLFALLIPQNVGAHASLGTGFDRPRSALERAAHTEALVIAKVTQAAKPLALPNQIPASTLAFEIQVLQTIAGNAPNHKVMVMQLGKSSWPILKEQSFCFR